jgi:CHAD domain-containing protein
MGKPRRIDGLSAHIDGLVDEIRRLVPSALGEFNAEAIHKSRVATRRLKAACELLSPVVASKPRRAVLRAGRKLRRRLGPLRDLDVMLGHVNELSPHADDRAVAWLRERLIERRDVARERAAASTNHAKALSKLAAWWDMRPQVAQARERIPGLLAESLHAQLDDFTTRAAEMNDPVAGPSSDPHQLRIAGKILRYTMELADASGKKFPTSVFRTFKRMQDALGWWHDYVVLTRTICEISAAQAVALHDAALQDGLLLLGRKTLARSRRELGNFSRLWMNHGQAVSQIIRRKFGEPAQPAAAADVPPASQSTDPPPAVSESQTDPDRADSSGNGHPASLPPAAAPAV